MIAYDVCNQVRVARISLKGGGGGGGGGSGNCRSRGEGVRVTKKIVQKSERLRKWTLIIIYVERKW